MQNGVVSAPGWNWLVIRDCKGDAGANPSGVDMGKMGTCTGKEQGRGRASTGPTRLPVCSPDRQVY